MNAQLIQDVKAELKQVQAELAAAVSAVDALRQQASVLTAVVELYESKDGGKEKLPHPVLGLVTEIKNWSGMTQSEACYRAVLEAGKPLSRQEIFRVLQEKGVHVKSSATLSPTLSTHPKLQHIGGGLWTAK